MSVRFGMIVRLFRCVGQRVDIADIKRRAGGEDRPALSNTRFLDVVGVNSKTLDPAISDDVHRHLNLVKISSGSADRRVTRRIRWSREAHLRPVLRLEVRERTKIKALRNSRAFGKVNPLDPTGILVRPIGDVERDIAFQPVDEQVAGIEPLQTKRNLEVVGAGLGISLKFMSNFSDLVISQI
jgi:hypothetical protein